MGIYTFVESLNNKELFRNIVIIIVFVYLSASYTIKLNIIFSIVLAVICILYLYEKERNTINIEEEQHKAKLASINPEPKNIKENKDLINFIFSVQDFYVYNPQAFEEMVDSIDAFKQLYNDIFTESQFSNYYYQIAETKKNDALNAFHSIIYKLPVNDIFTEKFNRAHKRLETILNNYINEIYDQCDFYLYRDGHDTLKKEIVIGPKEYNQYNDKEFTFEIY